MAFDSTANLLFNIGANADDATGNIAKFRGVLSKDLAGMQDELGAWSKNVFGSLTSGTAIATAGLAALAAGVVAVGAVLEHASEKYVEYADAVSRGMKLTGLHAEQMSLLHVAAVRTGTDYDSLINGPEIQQHDCEGVRGK